MAKHLGPKFDRIAQQLGGQQNQQRSAFAPPAVAQRGGKNVGGGSGFKGRRPQPVGRGDIFNRFQQSAQGQVQSGGGFKGRRPQPVGRGNTFQQSAQGQLQQRQAQPSGTGFPGSAGGAASQQGQAQDQLQVQLRELSSSEAANAAPARTNTGPILQPREQQVVARPVAAPTNTGPILQPRQQQVVAKPTPTPPTPREQPISAPVQRQLPVNRLPTPTLPTGQAPGPVLAGGRRRGQSASRRNAAFSNSLRNRGQRR